MNKHLGRFELLEQIDAGGHTSVHRAVEHMAEGIDRPAAVKILDSWNMEDETKAGLLRREVDLLVSVGGSPNVVTVYAFGTDDQAGPWLAMELGGKNLKHSITDEPADPDQVRVLLRDMLRALMVLHGSEPPILHRDLKPSNILGSEYGTWKITDFGLAKRSGDDDTLNLVTVQYAAPEALDATLGSESARMDLYSLGMLAYEFALGHELFRKQFPSIYDPSLDGTETGTDLRPKWMYWHTSMKMAVQPIGELIKDYPRDLSDLIAAMTVKPVEERIDSARKALAMLGHVEGTALPAATRQEGAEEPARRGVSPAILVALVVALLLAGSVGLMYLQRDARPVVRLDADGVFVGSTELIPVTGVIENFPDAGKAEIRLVGGATPFNALYDPEGDTFSCGVAMRELTQTDAYLYVKDRAGSQLARRKLTVERVPPEKVQVQVVTNPVVRGALVVVRDQADPTTPLELTTDGSGVATFEVSYGSFDLEVRHARYVPARGTFDTMYDPVRKKPIRAGMTALSPEEIYERTLKTIERVLELARRKADCELTPQEDTELQSSVDRLRELAFEDPVVAEFVATIERVEHCNSESLAADMEVPVLAPPAAPGSGVAEAREPRASGGGTVAPGPRGVLAGGLLDPAGILAAVKELPETKTLMAMGLEDFRRFIDANVPGGALAVESLPEIDRIRISGPLFNEDERKWLAFRLAPALPRLQLELRVDPWAVSHSIERGLTEAGAPGARAHAYLSPGDDTIFVQFTRDGSFEREDVLACAERFVIDPELLRVQGYPPPPPSEEQ